MHTTIPQLVARLQRCDAHDVHVLKTFITNFRSNMQSDDVPLYSGVLGYLITFSEFWERPTPSPAKMTTRFADSAVGWGQNQSLPLYCAFTKEQSKACAKYDFGKYDSQGIVYKRDQYWNASATIPSKASVLVLSSTMDMFAPHNYTKRLLDSLHGKNKELVVFNSGCRGNLASTSFDQRMRDYDTCGLRILMSYVTSDGDLAGLDKSCLDEMPAFKMISSDFSEANFTIHF